MTATKKLRRVVRFRILFLFSSFSLLQQGPGKGDILKRILPREGTRLLGRVRQPPQITWALHPLLVRGSKAGPSEGFNGRLMLLGLRAHY
jgi:hypothetical protein